MIVMIEMRIQWYLNELETGVGKTRESNSESGQKGFKLVRDTKNKDPVEYPEGIRWDFVVSKSYIISTARRPLVLCIAIWR